MSMPDFGDYIIYADESGDHSLDVIDEQYPVFVLTFCVFRKNDYINTAVPTFQRFKFDWFGHDAVIFHEREIRRQLPPFAFLQNRSKRNEFHSRLTELINRMPVKIFASAIKKHDLKTLYKNPKNPYDLALKFCMERLYYFLTDQNQIGRTTHCLFERRGFKEDEELRVEFVNIKSGSNYNQEKLDCLEPIFVDKKTNSCGLQLADLTARPIGLKVIRPNQDNRAYEVIERKFHRKAGRLEGIGLKIFP